MITLFGVGLIYFNKVSEASLTASGGAIATITTLNMAKEAKDELREILAEDEHED
jgi:hypothetical protein